VVVMKTEMRIFK